MSQLSRIVIRSLSSTRPVNAAKGDIHEGYFELKKVQEHFQKADGKPVFLKGSTMDQVLYRLTMGMSVVGICWSFKFFYDIANPAPPS